MDPDTITFLELTKLDDLADDTPDNSLLTFHGPAEATVSSSHHNPHQLRRTLSFFDGLCVVISIIIGSGIFASPGTYSTYCILVLKFVCF
jgi:hypothetical protein